MTHNVGQSCNKSFKTKKKNQWLVIDGSALSIMAEFPMDFQYPEKVVLTPHQMEWQRVSQIAIKDQTFEKKFSCPTKNYKQMSS